MRIFILIVFTAVLPVAWIVADCRAGAAARRALGFFAILWSFGVAGLLGSLERLNSNVYFTSASKDLLEASIQQLQAGRYEAVLREWERANTELSPTYENRARYRQIVENAVEGIKK